ncbi:Cyclopentanol dehydrogenase [Pseudomonas marincola]|uniref:Cyclopentanol dehydrogenase n=1 Tax=Pseudomonas marincola TaxID=437900 RepID=A0A653E8Z1_9PSED|nr:SDR family oxidoreductase [Pseudomonas marincola]CAE6920441.1 Cyclopentanol dehydrogenase [Pseudomonas marincola]
MNRLSNCVCLVTGAAAGIGLATAERLLQEGALVLLTDLDADAGQTQVERLRGEGLNAHFLQQDAACEEAWQRTMGHVREQWNVLDVLVNNAGIAILADVENLTLAQWRKSNAVNLDGVFLGTQQAIAMMKGRGGSIINIASIEGFIGEPMVPSYNAGKGGVRMFTKAAAAHCARKGYNIRINNVCPGYVATPMISGGMLGLPAEQAQAFQSYLGDRIPMGRLAEPAEIAGAVAFLASADASYVTGSDLVVDGGYLAQ